jgi:hypothetical protein
MVTEEDKIRIDAAMRAANGSFIEAAKALGMDCAKLRSAIHNNKSLKEVWTKKHGDTEPKALTEAQTMHRPVPEMPVPPADVPGVITAEDQTIATAIAREEALFTQGLDAMGIRGKDLQQAVALQQFMGGHFGSAIKMIGGGVTKQFLGIMAEIETINATLAALSYSGDESDMATAMREKSLREDRAKLYDLALKTFGAVNKAVLTQALVKQKLAAVSGGSGRSAASRKPGFGPLIDAK